MVPFEVHNNIPYLPASRDEPVMVTPPASAQRHKWKVPRAHPSRSITVAPVEEGADRLVLATAGIPPPPGLEESQESKTERLRREAASIAHMMTHVPKNPFCSACSRAETVARPHRANAFRSL